MKGSGLSITDQFCGAGGSSQGVKNLSKKLGGGIDVKLALNHWKLAIETHNTNFPDTLHDCTDISASDPRRYPSTNGLITSPECTNHSLAKGHKRKSQNQCDLFTNGELDPAADRSRATMWDVPRFAEYHDYEFIIVENVVDARYWVMFDAWLQAMHSLNYKHRCVYINSMHCQPTPQSRDRMYIVFWKKGNPDPDLEFKPEAYCEKCEKVVESVQWWKNPQKKWGKYKTQYLYRCSTCHSVVEPFYHAAFNCIDWSIQGTRIGDRTKPLSENTIRRIEFGLEKYCNEPMIVSTRYTSGIGNRVKSSLMPIGTQPGDVSHALLNPFFTMTEHSNQNITFGAKEPFRTQTTRQTAGVVVPFMVETFGGGKAKKLSEKLNTVTTHDKIGLVSPPFIVTNYKQSKAHSINSAIGTMATEIKHGIVTDKSLSAFLGYYYSSSDQNSGILEAVKTITTKDRAYLITGNGKPKLEDCHYRMLKPGEIQKAMAFDDDYIVLGNSREKVKQLGNAVTPPVMEWLTEKCVETLNK